MYWFRLKSANFPSRAYPLASLGHANWILRHYGYKPVFIWGLCLYAIGSLVAWPCILHRSFGGFCAAIFIIGNGLGSLETAANPYITGMAVIYLQTFVGLILGFVSGNISEVQD